MRLHIMLLVFIILETVYYLRLFYASGKALVALMSSLLCLYLISLLPRHCYSRKDSYIPLVLSVIAETLFISCLLLLSAGWSILTLRMGLRSKQLLTTAILLYGGFYLAYSLCSNTQNLRDVYEVSNTMLRLVVKANRCQLFFYVIKFLILFAATIALNAAGEFLRSEFSIHHPQRIFIAKKIMLFRQLRWMYLILLLVPIFMIFMDFTILGWQERWMSPVVNGWILLITFWTGRYPYVV